MQLAPTDPTANHPLFSTINQSVRRVLDYYSEGSVVTIPFGLARGCKWRRHHRYVNGYWTGVYEQPIQRLFGMLVGPGDHVFDVGANAGFFSVLAGKLCLPGGKVLAVDCLPENVSSINEQIEINGFKHCRCIQAAVCEESKNVTIYTSCDGSSTSHIGTMDSIEERAVVAPGETLDGLAERFGPPDFVKLDIEGAEVKALKGAEKVLREHRPRWLIELHGEHCKLSVVRALIQAGYSFLSMEGVAIEPEYVGRYAIAQPIANNGLHHASAFSGAGATVSPAVAL